MAAINKIKERPNTGLTTRRELAIREQSPLHHKPLVIIKKPNAKRKKGDTKGDWQKMLRTWHHCGRSDHYVTLFWSSDLKRSNGSEGTNTHTGFLRSLFAAGDKRWSVVRARACSREVSRGRFFCYRYLSESSTSFARKLFPTVSFALWGKSQIWCEFDCRDSMQFCCRFCICSKLWLLNTAIETWNLIDSRCEIFFRSVCFSVYERCRKY